MDEALDISLACALTVRLVSAPMSEAADEMAEEVKGETAPMEEKA